jgi:hypothetical protein
VTFRDHTPTVGASTEKPHIFKALRVPPVPFQHLPQKHRSIPDNPFAQFGTFSAANPQMRIAETVNPSFSRTRWAKIGRLPRTLSNEHFVDPRYPQFHVPFTYV